MQENRLLNEGLEGKILLSSPKLGMRTKSVMYVIVYSKIGVIAVSMNNIIGKYSLCDILQRHKMQGIYAGCDRRSKLADESMITVVSGGILQSESLLFITIDQNNVINFRFDSENFIRSYMDDNLNLKICIAVEGVSILETNSLENGVDNGEWIVAGTSPEMVSFLNTSSDPWKSMLQYLNIYGRDNSIQFIANIGHA